MAMAYAMAIYLLQVVAVSLSGVMSPGPVTAATVAAGVRRRHAGTWIALGHALVEFPLMLLVVLGAETVFKAGWFRVGVGLAGGAILLLMAGSMLAGSSRPAQADEPTAKAASPLWTGVVVTGGNPYFLLWWATVGLAIATQAIELGLFAFVLFVVVHWLCDVVWLEVLSRASYKGVSLLGPRGQRVIMVSCAVAMGLFGLWFFYDAGRVLLT